MLPMQTLSRHEGSVNCVIIHKDLLLSGSEDMEIKVCLFLNINSPNTAWHVVFADVRLYVVLFHFYCGCCCCCCFFFDTLLL